MNEEVICDMQFFGNTVKKTGTTTCRCNQKDVQEDNKDPHTLETNFPSQFLVVKSSEKWENTEHNGHQNLGQTGNTKKKSEQGEQEEKMGQEQKMIATLKKS